MDPEKTQLRVSKYINASRDKVYAAWTKPEIIKKWFFPGEMTVPIADVDTKVNGAYRIQMKNDEGKLFTTIGEYQEIVPNEKLVFTWGWEGPDRHESLVTVEFIDKDDGTEIILTHERLANAEDAEHHQQGWVGCLENLSICMDKV